MISNTRSTRTIGPLRRIIDSTPLAKCERHGYMVFLEKSTFSIFFISRYITNARLEGAFLFFFFFFHPYVSTLPVGFGSCVSLSNDRPPRGFFIAIEGGRLSFLIERKKRKQVGVPSLFINKAIVRVKRFFCFSTYL